MKRCNYFFFCFLILFTFKQYAQCVPSKEENIDFIATFGKDASGSWGDDDHVQTYFFSVQKSNKKPFYIRVFDPDCGGKNDQKNNQFNTSTFFGIYGGKGCYTNKDARNINPIGNYKSGLLLKSKVFKDEKEYDNNWYSFGPFNPDEGEFDKDLDAYVFKIIIEGKQGDDGNMYRFYFSQQADKNNAIEGGSAFAYEVCFRLMNTSKETAHFYPFVDSKVVSITQHNFDFDNDGEVMLTTLIKKLHKQDKSNNNEWQSTKNILQKEELNTSLDLQFIKQASSTNDATFYIANQYGEALPMFSSPIGGLPRYKYKIDIELQYDK